MRRTLHVLVMVIACVAPVSCGRERPMPDMVEIRDSMPVVRAMHDAAARDAMLDTVPGGEMARGDSAAAMTLLRSKL